MIFEGRDGAPGAMPERARNVPEILARLFRGALFRKDLLIALLAVTLFSIAVDLSIPLLIEGCVNAIGLSGAGGLDREGFFVCLAALALTAVLGFLLGYLHDRLAVSLSVTVETKLRQCVCDAILHMPLKSGERWTAGELISRGMNDTALAATAFSEALLSLCASIVVIVGCAVVMFLKCAPLAAISIAATLVSVILMGAVSRVLFPAIMERQSALGRVNVFAEESLRMFRAELCCGRLAQCRRRMARHNEEYYRRSVRAARLEGLMGPLMMMLGCLDFLLMVVFGARFTVSGVISLGTMQAFIVYSRQFMEPVNELGKCFAQVQSSLAAAERVFELLDTAPERTETPAREKETTVFPRDVKLRVRGLDFSYQPDRQILRGIHLDIHKGERLALVGRTGAGKTSLISLLLRLYDDYSGSISLDGQDIRAMTLSTLRSRITIIPQEPQMVEGTIFENIAYGGENITQEQVYQAAEAVGLSERVRRLPQGFATLVTSGGENFSQGELQLICLARAMVRNAEILVMDESTSSMDAETELALKHGVEALTRGKTCVTIAHRLVSVTDADHICVLEDGAVAEYGTHDELMAANGLYRSLYTAQLRGMKI